MAKNVPSISAKLNPDAPARVPLSASDPPIWDIVSDMMDSDHEMFRALVDGIGMTADFDSEDDRPALAGKLMIIAGLVRTAQYLDTDLTNLRDCQIEACMRACDDPEVRKAARS